MILAFVTLPGKEGDALCLRLAQVATPPEVASRLRQESNPDGADWSVTSGPGEEQDRGRGLLNRTLLASAEARHPRASG